MALERSTLLLDENLFTQNMKQRAKEASSKAPSLHSQEPFREMFIH